jgi:alcohol dehydrogenase class IV
MILNPTMAPSPGIAASDHPTSRGPVAVAPLELKSAPASPLLAAARPITLVQPEKILFGNGAVATFVAEIKSRGLKNLFVITSANLAAISGRLCADLGAVGAAVRVYDQINSEPSVAMFADCLQVARQQPVDGVIGFGGGSPMDVAKLVAALHDSGAQSIQEVFGINLLRGRGLFLACLPTTAGTGSEVSPNAILLDETTQLKQGVISPYLVPDVACVDPVLTRSVPPAITAATGLDALTHCIEAYANRNAHPVVDVYALEGIRRIGGSLATAVANGADLEARAAVALGSLYGGLCLGPVNTAAVHALAYPLGSEFHVAHGISNAVLLPHVLQFNLPAAVERYADIAQALGVDPAATAEETARRGITHLTKLMAGCPIPQRISELGVPRAALSRLAGRALTVTRLLKNNPRPLTEADALAIYESAW